MCEKIERAYRLHIDTFICLCISSHMATNIELDEELLSKAMELGHIRTKKDAVHQALKEFVQRREQVRILELFGTVEPDPTHDYKKQRRAG